MIKVNDCVKLDYNAYKTENNALFDTTSEESAKKAGLHREGINYEPISLLVGKGFIVKGVEESLIGRKEGDSYKVIISPEKGFGQRSIKYMENVKINEFLKEKINPVKGMIVDVNGKMGTIVMISQGRFAKVDFNHPLAGKELLYEIKIIAELNDDLNKIKSVTDFLLGREGVIIEQKTNEYFIKTKAEVPKNLQEMIKKTLEETLKKGSNLSFIVE